MNRRAVAWAAYSLWALCLLLSALGVVFWVLGAATPMPPGDFGFRGIDIIYTVAFSTVGAVIASRRPHNRVGWLFLAAGLGFAIVGFTYEYAVYAVLTRPGLLLGPEAAWVLNCVWPLTLAALAWVVLVFPDGRLLSPRWRPAAWVAGLGTALAAAGLALTPGPLDEFEAVDNPFGLQDAGMVVGLLTPVGMAAWGAALWLLGRRWWFGSAGPGASSASS
jgi:hypothetical protein